MAILVEVCQDLADNPSPSIDSGASPSDILVFSGVPLPGTPLSSGSLIINRPPGVPYSNGASTSVHEHTVPVTDIESVKEQIASHEMQEAEIAKKYGIPRNIDSPAILQTVKDMAWNPMESQYPLNEIVRDAEALGALVELRCRWEHLQELWLSAPRLPNSSKQPYEPTDPEPPRALYPDRSWGVIIGIDAYQTSPLRGCVSDALKFYGYLVDDLGVPKSHIQLLCAPRGDPSPDTTFPSRANIIQTLHNLHMNPLIQKDDDIIIYFSGHGASYRCSDYFPRREGGTAHIGRVEAICPADRTFDVNGHPIVPDISDRELNTILDLIYVEKGENITVITDCCYAGGVTRGMPDSLKRSTNRNLPPSSVSGLETMLRAGEENLKEYYPPGMVSVLAENWSPLEASHLLLAACTACQFAREVEKNDGTIDGIFTEALINALRSGLHNQSYYDLCCTVKAMTPSTQTPIVVGKNNNKVFPWYPRV